jgi:hypothetical protein
MMEGDIMRMTTRLLLAITATAFGSVVPGQLVEAAPPSNDDVSGATVVTTPLPFIDEVDTSDATTTPDEAALNAYCGAPAIERAVWYTSTAAGTGFAVFDVRTSDYSAGILVLSGSPGAFVPVTCEQGSVRGTVTSGQQLWFMVFDDGTSSGGGDILRVEVRLGVAAPAIELAVDPVAFVDRDGAATLTGTVTCTAPGGEPTLFGIEGFVSQRVGRGSVDGYLFADLGLPCDGTTMEWVGTVFPEPGQRFAGGKAATVAFSFACGPDQCGDAFVETTVQMRRSAPR